MLAGGEPRIRALVIADQCNPEWESVPLVGWSHAQALSQIADIHLVTRSWNLPALQRAGLVEGRDVTGIDTSALFLPMERLVRRITGPNKGWGVITALTLPSYLLFEQLLRQRFAARLRGGGFDLVHRLTPLSPAVPSLIAARCRRLGIPFVLGPLNGGLPWPAGFPDLRRQDGEFLSRLRGAHRLLPYYRSTRRDAAAILVGSAGALADLPRRWHDKSIYVPENGLDLARFPPPPPKRALVAGQPLRAVFLGRLVPAKGADMLIEAACALLAAGRMSLDIIGDGPERPRLEQLVRAHDLDRQVRFIGTVRHPQVAACLAGAHLLTFPSVHEFGGAVVLEAMAMGVVPVVVDYGGPAEFVSPASGFALPLGTREEIIVALRRTLEQIAAAPECLAPMALRSAARARACFAWPAKAAQTLEIYRWVLGWRPDKPAPALPFAEPAAEIEAGPVVRAG